MSKFALLRRIPLAALLLGALVVLGAGVAGAAPIGQITEFSAPGTNPAQVVAGPDGNLWFSDRGSPGVAGSVGQITTGGTVTRFTSGLNPGSAVRSIVMGTDGNMWFSDPGTTRAVGMINPTTHAISEFSSGLNAGSMPLGIAPGADGNIWFTDNGTTKAIGMINPTTHAITEFSSGLTPGTTLQQGMVAGPDGNLWFTESTPGGIGMINPTTHVISEFRIGLNAGSVPGASIVVGPDGALWFMDGGTTQAIGRIDPTTHAISEFTTGLNPGAALGRIAVGPDGNLWFGDKGTTKAIYVMNPTTHAITQDSAGLNTGSLPGGIWSGSDGNVWFTDQGPNATSPTNPAIGRIGAGAPAASVTAPTVSGSGGVNLPQTCGGDTWSTWAAQQPSHSAYGFDGYQWLLDGGPITGATGQSYTPTAADAGHQLSCKATVTYPLLVVTASATSTAVHVKGAAEQLGDLADAVVGVGPGGSLAAKVNAIQGYVAADDTADACAALGAFINEVNAQTGKKISSAQASSLITQAHNIEAALDC
jgi:streptogramin lyase